MIRRGRYERCGSRCSRRERDAHEHQRSYAVRCSTSSDSTTGVAREQSWAALLLAWVAAFSDAIGFLVLHQLGASFMSGNSMAMGVALGRLEWPAVQDRKSTRLNSSHLVISYAVFCLK